MSSHLSNQLLLKSIRPSDVFNGTDEQDPTTWLQSMEELFDAAKVEKPDRRRFLSMFFGDDVKKWYRSEDHSSEYDVFKTQFIKAFTSSTHMLNISTKLMNRRQGINESIQSYYYDVLSLCTRFNMQMPDNEKILYLLRGLKPSVKQHVIMSNPLTCQELLDHAKRAEAAASVNQPSSTVPTPTHDDTDEVSAALHRSSFPPSTHYNNRSSGTQQQVAMLQLLWFWPLFLSMSISFKLIRVPPDGSGTRSYTNPSPLVHIFVQINNIDTRAMIDTGSSISAINTSYLQQLNLNENIHPTSTTCNTANNGQLNVRGMIYLPVSINNISTIILTFIVDDLCANLLLGGDFCHQHTVNIDYGKKHLFMNINSQHLIVKFHQQLHHQQVFNVQTTTDISIPPLSTQIINASTSAPSMSAIFTPASAKLNKRGIIAPHALVEITDKSTILTLLNSTSSLQTITKGTIIGQIKYYEDKKWYYVDPSDLSDHPPYMASITHKSAPSNSHLSNTDSLTKLLCHLPKHQQDRIKYVLSKHTQLFNLSKASTIQSNDVYHRIPIPSHHQPIQCYPYRKSLKETQIINDQIKEMLDNRIIRPSSSPWSSPVVIIPKKDGSPRFCVDYRRLNLITERDVYPLPRIDDIIDRLAGSQYFSTLDLKAGYWQIPIAEEDKKKTAFVTTDGLFEFNVLPFGLSNAPASFQRIMNSILGTLRWDITLVYLDDIIIYSKSFEKHVAHLDLVLTALAKANVKLNPDKCSLVRKQLDYLGFRITQDGIKPTSTNVKKTMDFPVPTSAKAAYSFIQMAQFYRRFIKNFATVAAPFNAFKEKNARFVWTADCQKSFDTLKKTLAQYPLLWFYDGTSKLKLKINTDASNKGIGGVLHQVTPNGRLQPIQYLWRSLSKREQKYSVVEKECLAMVWCITKLRPYLYGQSFTLITDHHPLCWLNKQSSKNGRLDRWSLQLQEYTFDIKHTPGSSNCVADCLSRYPTGPPDSLVEDQLDLMHGQINHVNFNDSSPFDSTKIKQEQQADPKISILLDQLHKGKIRSSYIVDNDILHKIIHRPGDVVIKVPYIPASMVTSLLYAYHDSPPSGHLGVSKTWYKIRDRYFWPGMYNSIKTYVLACTKCLQFKIDRKKQTGTLQPIDPPTGILDLIGLDFVGPVPSSSSGNKYILVCTDYLSRYAITQATPNCTAETAAKFLVQNVVLQYGVPKQVLTDRGTHFMANVFEAIASRCGIHHLKTTTYHPQCNGLTERFNATLVDSIGTYVNEQQSDWDDFLPYVTFAYNTAKQSTTGIEPFKLMYGRDAILPFDVPQSITQLPSVNDYYLHLIRFLKQAKSSAWYQIKHTQNVYKRTYDTGRRDLTPLKPNQLVFLKQMMVKHLRKFSPKYYGPFRILRQLNRLNYEVKHIHDGHTERVHVSRIRIII
ncbi:unnamed protein product [Adineta ricciae]|nr:unnamed protein product [Adineta ricciae]